MYWVSQEWVNTEDGSNFLEKQKSPFPLKEVIYILKEFASCELTETLVMDGGSLAQSQATGDLFHMWIEELQQYNVFFCVLIIHVILFKSCRLDSFDQS